MQILVPLVLSHATSIEPQIEIGNEPGSKMSRRQSIYVDSFKHVNPVPAACRIGNIIYSGGVYGQEPITRRAAEGIEAQCALMFAHVRSIVEAAGGTTEDIIKMTLWMNDRSLRPVVNRDWIAMFPDEASRPTRQTLKGHLESGILIQCDFIAIL
jgi:2-iminobutanoate/2-iminopropanoate deaminase